MKKPIVRTISTRIPQVDALLGGGIQKLGSVLIVGPAGIGKTVMLNEIRRAMQKQQFFDGDIIAKGRDVVLIDGCDDVEMKSLVETTVKRRAIIAVSSDASKRAKSLFDVVIELSWTEKSSLPAQIVVASSKFHLQRFVLTGQPSRIHWIPSR